MGQNFVSINFGSPGAPKAVGRRHAGTPPEQPDLSAIMAKLDDAATGIENMTNSFHAATRSTTCSAR